MIIVKLTFNVSLYKEFLILCHWFYINSKIMNNNSSTENGQQNDEVSSNHESEALFSPSTIRNDGQRSLVCSLI